MAEKEKQLLQSSNLLRQQLAQGQITNLDIKTSKREGGSRKRVLRYNLFSTGNGPTCTREDFLVIIKLKD